jgi:hypothetical protein
VKKKKEVDMYGPFPYYYPPNPIPTPQVNSAKEAKKWIKFLEAWEEEKKKKEKKDHVPHVPKGARIELLMIFTMLTPIIGSMYFWIMVYFLRQTLEMLQTLPR